MLIDVTYKWPTEGGVPDSTTIRMNLKDGERRWWLDPPDLFYSPRSRITGEQLVIRLKPGQAVLVSEKTVEGG